MVYPGVIEMNIVLKKMGQFVRDLLVIDEQLIRIGRQNFIQADFETDYVVIDSLGPALRMAGLSTYDDVAEILSLGGIWRGPVTLDFYGSNTYTRAIEFSLKAQSQTALELKKAFGIAVFHASGPTDVKQLTGQQYGERMQIEMQVEISLEVDIATKRIDTAPMIIKDEQGIQYNG